MRRCPSRLTKGAASEAERILAAKAGRAGRHQFAARLKNTPGAAAVEILGCSRSRSYRPRGRGRCGQQTGANDSCVASHSRIIFELGLG